MTDEEKHKFIQFLRNHNLLREWADMCDGDAIHKLHEKLIETVADTSEEMGVEKLPPEGIIPTLLFVATVVAHIAGIDKIFLLKALADMPDTRIFDAKDPRCKECDSYEECDSKQKNPDGGKIIFTNKCAASGVEIPGANVSDDTRWN